MEKQRTLFLYLSNKQVVCYRHMLLIDLRPKLTIRHSLVHKSKVKKKNYLDRMVTNPLTVFLLKGDTKTNLKIFLSLRYLSGYYEKKHTFQENETLIDDLDSENETISLKEEKEIYTLRDWEDRIFNINKEEYNGMLFNDYIAKDKQEIIISLLNKDRKRWMSLFKKDIITCLNLANFLRFDFFNYFNVSSSFISIEKNLHEIFCKKVKVNDVISEIEENYRLIMSNYKKKKSISKDLFKVFDNLFYYEDILKIKEKTINKY